MQNQNTPLKLLDWVHDRIRVKLCILERHNERFDSFATKTNVKRLGLGNSFLVIDCKPNRKISRYNEQIFPIFD